MKGKIVNQRFEDVIKHAFILVIKGDILSSNCAFEKMGGKYIKERNSRNFLKNDKSI